MAFFYGRRQSELTDCHNYSEFSLWWRSGVFAAALLEPIFIARLDFFTIFVVGLIEEFAKILGVLMIARHRRHDAELDGLILGQRPAWALPPWKAAATVCRISG